MKRENMSNTDVRGKITNWLLEEGLSHTLTPDENFDFVIRVSNVYGNFYVDICKEKGRERILIQLTLSYEDEPTQKVFSKLKLKEKEDFQFNLRVGIMNYDADWNIQPPKFDEFHTVSIFRLVYLEDMRKSDFMNGLNSVRNSVAFVTLLVHKHLSEDTSASQPKTMTGGMG